MKQKMKIIKMDVFPWDILFSIGSTEKQVTDYLKKTVGYELDQEEKHALQWDNTAKRGRTLMLKNNAVIMWVKENEFALIAHEALHATTFILERAGLKFSESSDEAWAYMIEKIVRQAF